MNIYILFSIKLKNVPKISHIITKNEKKYGLKKFEDVGKNVQQFAMHVKVTPAYLNYYIIGLW